MVFLLHVHSEPVTVQIGHQFITMPPGEPVEFDSQFEADAVLSIWGRVYGIIQLEAAKSRTGIHLNLDEGERQAKAYLEQCSTSLLHEYVRVQQEDRVKNNLPVTPPSGRVKEVIEERHIDMKKAFNLDIVGYASTEDPQIALLKAENDRLRAEALTTQAQMAAIFDRLGKIESASPRKPAK